MAPALGTHRLRLMPVAAGDEDPICELLWRPEVRRYLCDDALLPREAVHEMIRDSLDPGSVTAYWRIATPAGATIGLVGLKAPMAAMLALRAIGWRSLELLVALDPRHWGSGLATEAIAAVAAHSEADGVTFAIVAGVDAPNARSHKLMGRCGFQELGRIPGPAHPIVVYEKAL